MTIAIVDDNNVYRLGGYWDTSEQRHQAGSVFDTGGIMTTLMAAMCNNGVPNVIEVIKR